MSTSDNSIKSAQKPNSPFLLNIFKFAISSLFSSKSQNNDIPKEDHTLELDLTPPKNRFLEAAARVFESPHYAASTSDEAPYGYFLGRHIIGDCTRISGGIYVGHNAQETIVIDERYKVLSHVYQDLLKQIENSSLNPAHAEYEIFNQAIATASNAIAIDADEVKHFREQQKVGIDGKVSLDVFVTQGYGLDYHQVLLAAYLLERLADDKKLSGIVTIDSCLSAEQESGLVLLYTSSSGYVLRFSPLERRIAEIIH
jgi:hypothetical protein